ncbi:hypothetical protein H5410_029113 [Solanum commersonii]|uniref:xyloglucan:xyloglucosyl transferase n=1 Tax=Solanum commersonii TaxID=4109 RepID=A0A9J5Z5W7_SOLCO|nr:hypothetical protein H5410_029113 [Solanum commersonii]
MRIKLPNKDSAGVVTTFYVIEKGNHTYCKQMYLQMVLVIEKKEFNFGLIQQQTFMSTQSYGIHITLCNFFVDEMPIRVYKNKSHRGIGYPTQPMQSEATIWNGESWATENGSEKINWSNSPFIAQFQGFNIEGCPSNNNSLNCNSTKLGWNSKKLTHNQEKSYKDIRSKNMIYDYCKDTNRFQNIPLECSSDY